MFVGVFAFAQQTQFPTDPKTWRAIGAKEITPEQLRQHIDKNTKMLIIDVRDPEEFEKETMKGGRAPSTFLRPRFRPEDIGLSL
jgi:3-mercaptopyruvate sulfurtransferase SseA